MQTLPDHYPQALVLMMKQSGPWVLLVSIITSLVLRGLYGPPTVWDGVVFSMFFFGRGIIEWLVHTYVLHARPLPWLRWQCRSALSRMHAEHHKHPSDINTLFFGGKSVLLTTLVMAVTFSMIMPRQELALTLLSTILLNTLLYEWCHLLAHSTITPRSGLFRRLILNHRWHHYQDGQKWLGVSSTLGDRLFGTYH